MKASRAAVRQVRALEKTAASMGRVEDLVNWMIANFQELGALPELPEELQELEAQSGDAPLEEESTESSSEDEKGEDSEAPQPEELEADSTESAVKPTEELKIDSIESATKLTEEVEISLPVTKVKT